jgi:hypothetical protein
VFVALLKEPLFSQLFEMPKTVDQQRQNWLSENMKRYTLYFHRKSLIVILAVITLVLYPIGIWLFSNNAPVI